MVIVLDAQTALTPAGRPLDPVTLLLEILVAPRVVWVMSGIGVLIHTVGLFDATDTLKGSTTTAPDILLLTEGQPVEPELTIQ